MRGERLNTCCHCGKRFLGSACVVKVTCSECLEAKHRDGFGTDCPVCFPRRIVELSAAPCPTCTMPDFCLETGCHKQVGYEQGELSI
jgi:hypothetical protein